MENKKRFFAFGCSFTSFIWPTWADIIAHEFHAQGKEAYNFGLSGSGNENIMHSVIKAYHDYDINDDDLVIIMWTSWNRMDYINGAYWAQWGNILRFDGVDEEHAGMMTTWSLELDIVKSISAYTAVNNLINVSANFSLAHEVFHIVSPEDDPLLYKYINFRMPNTWNFKSRQAVHGILAWWVHKYDGHPTPLTHLQFTQTKLRRQLPDLQISDSTVEWVRGIEAECNDKLEEMRLAAPGQKVAEQTFWDFKSWCSDNMDHGPWCTNTPQHSQVLWPTQLGEYTIDVASYLDTFEQSLKK